MCIDLLTQWYEALPPKPGYITLLGLELRRAVYPGCSWRERHVLMHNDNYMTRRRVALKQTLQTSIHFNYRVQS